MPGVRQVSLRRKGGASVLIPIKPLVLGGIPVSVEAKSSTVAEFVNATLLVKVLRGFNQLLMQQIKV